MILGDLTASHLGHVVSWTDGGATFTGTLHAVKHKQEPWHSHASRLRTFIAIQHGAWRHEDTYSSFIAVVVDPVAAQPGQTPASTDINGM